MKFSIRNFYNKCDQIRKKLRWIRTTPSQFLRKAALKRLVVEREKHQLQPHSLNKLVGFTVTKITDKTGAQSRIFRGRGGF